ncbi:MAG: nuclear transport factor 2 family protein [Cyanobacteria bacterium P01_E01_bin.42]
METLNNQQSTSAEELIELERQSYRKFQAGNIDSLMDDYLTEDALVCPPGIEAIKGREQQRVLFKELAQMEGFELFWEPTEAHTSDSDDMGWVYGSVKWKMPNQAEQIGKYISIWSKVDGEWKNVVEIRNSNS